MSPLLRCVIGSEAFLSNGLEVITCTQSEMKARKSPRLINMFDGREVARFGIIYLHRQCKNEEFGDSASFLRCEIEIGTEHSVAGLSSRKGRSDEFSEPTVIMRMCIETNG